MIKKRISRTILTVLMIGAMTFGIMLAGTIGSTLTRAAGLPDTWVSEVYADEDMLDPVIDDENLKTVIRMIINYRNQQGGDIYDYIHSDAFAQDHPGELERHGDRLSEYTEGAEGKSLVDQYNLPIYGNHANWLAEYDGQIRLWDYGNPDATHTISKINGLGSLLISASAVTLPSNMTSVPATAFKDMTGLTSVEMPDTVTEIGEGAFESCSSLRSLLVLNHQTGAKLGPAEYNTGDPEYDAVYLGGVSTIGREAFSSCTAIQIVDFDADDTTNVNISSNAFSTCTSLTSVTVPKGSLGTGVFSSCHSLSHIAFHDSYTEIPGNILSGIENPLIIDFPSSLKRIGSGACAGNIILDMNLNECAQLEEIDEQAFKGTAFLMSSMTSSETQSLFDLSRNTKLTTIRHEAFAGASFEPDTVLLPDCVSAMGSAVFFNTSGIESINIPGSMKTIPDGTFMCSRDLSTVNAPDSQVKSIGKHAFDLCRSLTGIDFINSMEELEEIGDFAFARCVPDSHDLTDTSREYGLRAIVLPGDDRQITVRASAFEGDFMVSSVQVGTSVKDIPDHFLMCGSTSDLTNPTAPTKSLTWEDIALLDPITQTETTYPFKTGDTTGYKNLRNDYKYNQSLAQMSRLTQITLHDSIESIGQYAFFGHANLTMGLSLPTQLATLGKAAFANCARSFTEDGETRFSGLQSVTIPSGNSIETIEESAFRNDFNLERVTFPSNIEEIPAHCFDGCGKDYQSGGETKYHGLTIVSDIAYLKSIGDYAFRKCYNLKNKSDSAAITFGNKLENLGKYAFADTGIASASTLSSTKIEEIKEGTFEYCHNLTIANCPDTLTGIGANAFRNCEKIATIKFPVYASLSKTMIYNAKSSVDLIPSLGRYLGTRFKVPIGQTIPLPSDAFARHSSDTYKQVNEADSSDPGAALTSFEVQYDTGTGYSVTGKAEAQNMALRIAVEVPFDSNTTKRMSIDYPVDVDSTHADQDTMLFDESKFKVGTSTVTPVDQDGTKVLYISKKNIGKELTLALNAQSTDAENPGIITDAAVWTVKSGNAIALKQDSVTQTTGATQTTTTAKFNINNVGSAVVRIAFDDTSTTSDPYKEYQIEVLEPITALDYTLDSIGDVKPNLSSLVMPVGQTDKLVVTPTYATSDHRDDVTFKSSQPSIVSVDKNGNINALTTGTAVITIGTLSGDVSKKITITVRDNNDQIDPQYIEIHCDQMTDENKKGLVYTSKATRFTAMVLPDYATKKLDWSVGSTVASYVTITPVNGGVSADVTGINSKESITLTAKGKSGTAKGTMPIVVRSESDSIEIRETPPTIAVGDIRSMNVTNIQTQTNGVVRVPAGTSWPVTFTSSNESVLKLGKSKTTCDEKEVTLSGTTTSTTIHYRGVKEGTATITASIGNGKSSTITVTVINSPITSLTCSNGAVSLMRSGTTTMQITQEPENSKDEITYKSSNSSVASVDDNGKITAVSTGTAKITAQSGVKGVKAYCNVTVYEKASSLNFKQDSLTVKTGTKGSLPLSSDANQQKGIVRTPTTSAESVTFTSSDPSILTIGKTSAECSDAETTLTGKKATLHYLPLQAGTVKITAKSESGLTTTLSVTVVEPITKLTCENRTLELMRGRTSNMQVTKQPASSKEKIVYKSSHPSVASVDANGKITALEVGTSRITASAEVSKKTVTCNVTVYEKASGLVFKEEPLYLERGGTGSFRLSSNSGQSGGIIRTPVDSQEKVTFTSSDSSVFLLGSEKGDCTKKSVTLKGKTATLYYRGKALGTAKITAKSESGLTATLNVTVVDPIVQLSTNKTKRTILKTRSFKMKVTKVPSTSKEAITFTSSKPDVATVSKTGKVKAVGYGTTTITAKSSVKKVSVRCTVTVPKPGQKIRIGEYTYKVNKRPNLSFAGVTSSVTKVVIPAKVKFDGKAYRVTGVSAKACYNNRTITKVTIGKNVTSVGSKAFYGCVKLKTVNIKSKRITKIKKNSFKTGYKKGTTFKCPSGKKAKYKKLLKKSGISKKSKIK